MGRTKNKATEFKGKVFPFSKDPDFCKLESEDQMFIFNIYNRAHTGDTKSDCYKKAYNRPDLSRAYGHMYAFQKSNRLKLKPILEKIERFRAAQLEIDSLKILEEEGCIAFSDVTKLFDKNGKLLVNPKDLPKDIRKAISAIEVTTAPNGNITYKFKLWNKGDSLKRLEAVKGMVAPVSHNIKGIMEHTVNNGIDLSKLSDTEIRMLEKISTKNED